VPSLSMPLFVSPADVILRMQLSSDLSGIEDVVSSGIIGAQLHVQRIIDGQLSRQTQDRNYFLDAESFSGIAPGGLYKIEVPSGLIRTDTDVVVTASNGPFGIFENADITLVRTDHGRGYIYLDAATYGNAYIRVICDTGYEDGTSPLSTIDIPDFVPSQSYVIGDLVQFGGRVYKCYIANSEATLTPENWRYAYVPMEQIPAELTEAIISLVPLVFNSSQATNRSEEAVQQYRTVTDHAAMLLQSYVRTRGFSFRPI